MVAIATDHEFLSRLNGLRKTSTGWRARCPAHNDKNPSLAIDVGRKGQLLLICRSAGCKPEAIVAAVGCDMRTLFTECERVASNAPQLPPPPRSTLPADAVDKTPAGDPEKRGFVTAAPATTEDGHATAREAVAALVGRLGPIAQHWTYEDADGQPVGLVLRWDLPGGKKTIRPISRIDGRWFEKAMPEPRPLYCLPELADSPAVFVCEGEKAADAIREIGLVATTSAGGSNGHSKTDWRPLAGKVVTILPDADDAGRAYAENVARILEGLRPRPTVKILELPDLPLKGDAVEFVAARREAGLDENEIRREIERLAEQTETVEPAASPAVPAAYRPFPVCVLPEPVQTFVREGAEAIGCDCSYVALPVLAVIGSAIGNACRIAVKPGWLEPPVIWAVIVGESGTSKTPAMNLAVQPVLDRQSQSFEEHRRLDERHQLDLARHERELAAWRKSGADADPPTKPQPVSPVRSLVSDVTIEALAPVLLANPKGVLVVRDELGAWLGGFGRYKSSGQGDGEAGAWLSMFGASPITVDRRSGQPKTIHVPAAAVSVVGGVQPGVLDRMLGVHHRENGLLARFLLAMPPRTAKRWTDRGVNDGVRELYAGLVTRLYELQPAEDGSPRVLPFTDSGRKAWVPFYNRHARRLAEATGDYAATLAKLEAYAARLSLVVHAVRCAASDDTVEDGGRVDGASVAVAVALVDWFAAEAERIFARWNENPEQAQQRELAELVARSGGRITARQLGRRSRAYRPADVATAALDSLVAGGYGLWAAVASEKEGGRPSKTFVLGESSADDPGG